MMLTDRNSRYCDGRITRRSIKPRLIFIGNPIEVEERIARTLQSKMKAMEKLDKPENAGNLSV